MKSEWLIDAINKLVDDYDKYINANNSCAGLRFRNMALEIIKMLKKDRIEIQKLRHVRDDYKLRYTRGFEERRQKILENESIHYRENKHLLSRKAQLRKKAAIKKKKMGKDRCIESYDIF